VEEKLKDSNTQSVESAVSIIYASGSITMSYDSFFIKVNMLILMITSASRRHKATWTDTVPAAKRRLLDRFKKKRMATLAFPAELPYIMRWTY
jgi:hypothetical protein